MTHETELNLFSSILNISKEHMRGDVYKRAITSLIINSNRLRKIFYTNRNLKKILLPSMPLKILWGNKKTCMRDASIRLKTARISGANKRFSWNTVLE